MVRFQPDPPEDGGLAQLGEHLLCKQGVVGSIPSSSTRPLGTDQEAEVSAARAVLTYDPWSAKSVRSLTKWKKVVSLVADKQIASDTVVIASILY